MAETALTQSQPIGRREFLFYIWSASMAVTLATGVGSVLWYAYPRFRAGEFGGEFVLSPQAIPSTDAAPEDHPGGRFWLVNTEGGLLAIYKVCTHLGCLYKWTPPSDRFECPCHGSKFTRDGVKIEGPAPRNLDRFVIQVLDAEGTVIAETQVGDAAVDPAAGQPVPIPISAAEIRILTSERIKGAPASV